MNEQVNKHMKKTPSSEPLIERINEKRDQLTPKGRVLAEYVLQNPRDAVFLRTRGLASACGVSEATVMRFVDRLGFVGYKDFIRALRDLVDAELTLADRIDFAMMGAKETEGLKRVVLEEIGNLKRLLKNLDLQAIHEAVALLKKASEIYVIGSRLSYTFAYYLGWSLSKLRPRVSVLKGSDSTTIDLITLCPKPALFVVIATTRYPNEILRLAKVVRRNGHKLLLITDSKLCPVLQFAQLTLIASCEQFPLVGSPSSISCLINCLTLEFVNQSGEGVKQHQKKLEQAFVENDILFNLEKI